MVADQFVKLFASQDLSQVSGWWDWQVATTRLFLTHFCEEGLSKAVCIGSNSWLQMNHGTGSAHMGQGGGAKFQPGPRGFTLSASTSAGTNFTIDQGSPDGMPRL